MLNNIQREIEGIGISSDVKNLHLCPGSYFKQITVHEKVTIPSVKPDIEHVLSVVVEPKILSYNIINTPRGCSAEGQNLTGKKLMIELELNQTVKYVADEETQSVHAAHFNKLVSGLWVVVPPSVNVLDCKGNIKNICIEQLLREGRISVTPYIEDIYADQLNKREVFKNITLLVVVTVKNEVGLPNPCIFKCSDCYYQNNIYYNCCYDANYGYVPCDYYYHNLCVPYYQTCMPINRDCEKDCLGDQC